ncbi:diguanylate cyclase domain protein [Staphylococcus aureus]|uniref:Diguanylate cyclase domain protein n=1 Tax=Staphylococcus aureus TaxID=1280 RepID=A0A380E1R6_STAAU|nr:diguanylate cyclase domain protein [Staphylococcus aureus]
MFEAFIYNISVIVAGIYLFHRLQYSENKRMVFLRLMSLFNDNRIIIIICLPYPLS